MTTHALASVHPGTVIMLLIMREWRRLLKQPARIAASIGTPVLLWLFIGSGFAQSLQPAALDSLTYQQFLLPGMLTLVATFAAIFTSISLIEDRQSGWLQTVLASPAPRWSIALGLLLAAASTAFAQCVLLLLGALMLGISLAIEAVALSLIAVAITCIAMAALGLTFAWLSATTAGFHSVMNLIIMPMWLLSGALFPPAGAAPWLSIIVAINPLTWITNLLRASLWPGTDAAAPSLFMISAALSILFMLGMMLLAIITIARPTRQ